MRSSNQELVRKVLIASANPLFAKGLQKMVEQRWASQGAEVRIASSMAEATAALESWAPDLVIVDYDDVGRPGSISREEFLNRFIAGKRPMQVMLVSLQQSGEVVVYDRRTMTPAQAEDWLNLPEGEPEEPAHTAPPAPERSPAGTRTGSLRPVLPISTTEFGLRSGGMKHYAIAGVLTIILTIILGLFLTNIGLMPVQASTEAIPVDAMINLQAWLIAFLFSLIFVFIIYSVVVFRRKPGVQRTPAFFKSSSRLEVIWTLVPLFTVIYLAFLGARDLAKIKEVDPSALEVKVTAFQWGWIFQYPDLNVQSNVLYLPVNKQVHLVMTSRDVIHSFWIPEMRIKQDVLPGENLVKELRLTPDRIGDYKVRCAELCGGAHAYMESPVKVVSFQDFQDWTTGQQGGGNLSAAAKQGRDISNQTGCTGCHSIDGSKMAGPTWKGLAGKQEKLADGSTVTADDAYLHESIVDPNAKIVQGFPPSVMPQNYKDTLTDDQIKAIIEYIKALK